MFGGLEYDALMSYFNLGIIVVIALGALIGFFSGLYKSMYKLIIFTVLLLIGWFASPIFINMMMSFNVTSIIPVPIEGFTSINAYIPTMLESSGDAYISGIVAGTMAYSLVLAFVHMALRIVFLIIWLILMSTIFKFFFWIFYLIIKPRKRDKAGNKRKKNILSRFSGAAVGALHATLVIFLFSIALAGLSSIGNSIKEVAINLPDNQTVPLNTSDNDEEVYQLLISDYQSLASDEIDAILNDDAFRFMENYRSTYSGKISGVIKIGGVSFDEYLFDEILSVKLDNREVKLRIELQTASRIVTLISENSSELSLTGLASLDDEVLTEIVEEVAKLKIIQIAIPVGVDLALSTDAFDKYLGVLPASINIEELLEEVMNINYKNEIEHLGLSVVDVIKLDLLSKEKTNDFYFNLDPTIVTSLFNNIGELELINILGDVASQFMLNSEDMTKFYTSVGISSDDLNLDNVVWGDEFKNLGNVYQAFSSLGMNFVDQNTINLDLVTDETINNLGIAIFNSTLLSDNNELLAQALSSKLPENYRNVIEINQFELNDFTNILALGKVLISSGILNQENFDPLELLTEDNIDKIAGYISSSTLLSSNINGVLDILLTEVKLPDTLNIVIPDDIVWTGETGKTELKALFTASAKLVELGLGNDDFGTSLTKEKIDELSDAISESEVLMSNVGQIIEYILSDQSFTGGLVFTIREIDWTTEAGKTEFKAILSAASTVIEAGLMDNPDFTTFSDGTVDTNSDGLIDENDDNLIGDLAFNLSSSIIIKDNLSNLIDQIVTDAAMDFEVQTFTNPEDWTEVELDSLLRSVKIISSKTNLPEDLFTLTDDELDTLLLSILITNSIVNKIEEFTAVDGELYNILIIDNVVTWEDTYDVDNNRTDGELRKLFESSSILLGDNPDFTNTDTLIDLNRVLNLSDGTVDTNSDGLIDENDDDQLGEVLSSVVLKDSMVKVLIDLGEDKTDEFGTITEEAVLTVNLAQDDQRWQDEIKSFIVAIKIILGDTIDLNNINIDINILKELSTGDTDPEDDQVKDILESIIMTDTIIDQIIDLDTTLVVNLDSTDPRWRDGEDTDGEIRNIIRAVQIIFDDELDDLNSPNIDPNIVLELTDGTVDTNGDTIVNDQDSDELGEVLKSIIISDTIIKEIIELNGEVLVVTLDADNPLWKESENSAGEIKNLVRAVNIVLYSEEGLNPDLNNPVIKTQSELMRLTDAEVDILLDSIIVSNTMVKEIKAVDTLTIPLELQGVDNEYKWYDTLDEDGELRRIIKVASLLMDEGATTINTDKVLNLSETDIDTVLVSTSKTPPLSLSCLNKSLTSSHKLAVASVAPVKNAASP